MKNSELNAVGQLQEIKKKDPYTVSRAFIMVEALVEYLISLTVTGAFLAKITESIGMQDSLTGIITAFASLGNLFQLFALFFVRLKRVSPIVTVATLIKQICFGTLYIIPFLSLQGSGKTVLFTVLILSAYIIANLFASCKTNWYMSLVDTRGIGIFTAKKEMISLLFGMLYSLLIGNVVTHFEDRGELRTAFVICAVGVFTLTVIQVIFLILIKEKPIGCSDIPAVNAGEKKHSLNFLSCLKDKRLLAVTGVYFLWSIANYITTPFYGTYQNKELGFSLAFISLISVLSSIARMAVSIPLGRFADKHSFTNMLTITFTIAGLGFLLCAFTTPSNGSVFFTIYTITHAIAMAGINSGAINLIYEYVQTENKTGALAFNFASCGLTGFLATLAASPLVDYIQKNGNNFLGLNVYAQQVVSFMGAIIVAIIIVYLNTVVRKLKPRKEEN